MSSVNRSDQHDSHHSATDERTSLLANASVAPTAAPDTAEASVKDIADDDKPLPKTQILLLCFARLVEPVAFFGIFPFINQMVQQNGHLNEAEVGFYSGLIESLFSLTQMIVMIFWGRASDRVGRKPVLITSMVGVTVMTAAFGFARTLWQMILFRCLAGIFAGTIVTIRVMISELSTPKTQARAFSLFMVANNLGIFIGPLLGGALADPAGQYGGIFKKIQFFTMFPYALSTIVAGALSLTATITAAVFIEETLPSKRLVDREANRNKTKSESLTTWQLLRYPGVALVLYLYTHVMLLAYSYTAIIPVFYFTSAKLGGFGLTPFQMSLFMASGGAAQALWTLLVFPPLQHRYGTGWVLRACSIGYLIFFCVPPLLNAWLRHAEASHVGWQMTLFWILAPTLNCIGAGVSMSFTGIQLALNDITPSPAVLGTLNGLALSASSGVRAFSPALFTSIFAVGVKKQILSGYLIWLVLLIIVLGFIVIARVIPAKADGRPKKVDDAAGQESDRSRP